MERMTRQVARPGRTGAHRLVAILVGLFAVFSSTSALSGVAIDNKPLTVTNSVPGNLVLLPSVEWPTVVTHANAPGVAEGTANYASATAYAGYFNSGLCYAYHFDVVEANRYFYPHSATSSGHSCAGQTGGTPSQRLWSGNFLNWSAMQAIDTFRLALTGGYRVHRPADGTPAAGYSEMNNVTYLEKANSDRWENGYTPLRRLASNAGNSTPVQTSTLRTRIGGLRSQMWFIPSSSGEMGSAQAWNAPAALARPVTGDVQQAPAGTAVTAVPYNPQYNLLPNSDTTTVINDTACGVGEFGCEATTIQTCPASHPTLSNGRCYNNRNQWVNPTNATRYRHTTYGRNQAYALSMRVKVCDGSLDTRSLCTRYGSNYKPEGLLQQNSKKTRYSLFAYLTQDGGSSRRGGVMRARQKLIGPVTAAETAGTEKPYPDRVGRISGVDNAEWDLATGKIINNPDSTDSSSTSTRVGACASGSVAPDGSGCTIQYSGVINYLNRFGQINTGMATLKAYDNLSEMYHTALRYLRGVGNVSAYSNLAGVSPNLTRYQYADGLPVIDNWYGTGANAAVTRWNADPDDLRTVGTDRDPMLYQCQANVFLGIGDTATQNESKDHSGSGDIATGFVDTWLNYMVAADRDTRAQNSTAALAYWGHVTDIRTDVPNTTLSTTPARAKGQSISTYWVDVVELNDLKAKKTNQYYLATKYGGFTIPETSYDANGNAARPADNWFETTNKTAWTSATQTAKAQTGLGGTGDFNLPNNMYLANNGQAMIDGLNAAFQKIADDITGSGGSFASNSTRLEAGSRTYQAKYVSNGWGGQLIAADVNVSTGTLTNRWDASDWLGHAAGETKINTAAAGGGTSYWNYTQRKILFNSSGTLTNFISNWSNYTSLTSPTVVRPAAWSSTTTISNEQLRYVLGERVHERQSVVTGSLRQFRNRRGMLGDIINSQPVYVGRPNANLYSDDTSYATFVAAQAGRDPVVYVGANDGMLHAFQAPDALDTTNAGDGGKELFAFMPTEAMSVLTQLDASTNKYPNWHPEYDHAYSMDGEITVADVKDGTTWKTILVATMGRGGKSIFALDVTDPTNPSLLWEKRSDDAAIGNLMGNALGRPIIAAVAAGDWRVFLGNGANNQAERSALIMLDAISGVNKGSMDTGIGSNNGLSAVNVWDAYGASEGAPRDGYFDSVYAGDMEGNLWKFDVRSGGTATRLFAAGTTQPITAAPLVASNPYSPPDTWVFFGTGQYLSMADINETANANVQSWYGIIDRGSTVAKTSLNAVRITAEDSVGRVIERAGAAGTNGWYINLVSPAATAGGDPVTRGERMVLPNFFQGMSLIGTTRFPDSTDPCAPAGKGFTMAIDPFTGGRLSNPFFDIDGDGSVGSDGDYHGGDTETPYSGVAYDSGPNNPIFLGEYMYTSLDDGSYSQIKTSSGAANIRRVSWRELLNAQ
ncbi:pilus assembly protein [Luteimonas sp. A611]